MQRGFSLIELLVALLILTLVITTTLAVFTERQRRLQLANETILVYQALANETEVRRRIGFSDPGLGSPAFQSPVEILRPLRPFTASVAVQQTSADVKNVTMSVVWHGGLRRASLTIIRVDTGGSNLW
jgi:prepilin-type N-terminal cleavage/methylation domain-containing protein